MKDLIHRVVTDQEEDCSLTLHNPHKLVRDVKRKKIQTVEQDKMYRLVFDKRVLDSDTYLSYPYGYGEM